uniref:Uncharacterized protein n=1 Tax=Romanomermis culicivorax TaxID=13658 RepID=A0A915HKS0_ROMCU
MGGVDNIDNAEFFGPEASNPSQNERGNVSNDGCAGPVVLTEIGAVGGSKVVCVNVVGVADVRPVGGSNMAVGGSNAEDDVAGSTSIGGVGGRGTLNTVFGGFFKASRRL